jgi:hypothetical protein
MPDDHFSGCNEQEAKYWYDDDKDLGRNAFCANAKLLWLCCARRGGSSRSTKMLHNTVTLISLYHDGIFTRSLVETAFYIDPSWHVAMCDYELFGRAVMYIIPLHIIEYVFDSSMCKKTSISKEPNSPFPQNLNLRPFLQKQTDWTQNHL